MGNALASANPALAVISAMLTPAILILAAGSLANSTLVRLARTVDRTRQLIAEGDLFHRAGNMKAVAIIGGRVDVQVRRAELARRALGGYYLAIAMFLLASLVIALNQILGDRYPYAGPIIVILGGFVLFIATATIVIEVNISAGTLREEVRQYHARELEP
jgi:hypothetical protein